MKNLIYLSLLFVASFASGQVDLNNGLIARYRFNGDATDWSPNHLDGTLHGNATANRVLSVGDNTSDYLELPPSVMNGLGDFTVSLSISFNSIHTTGSFPTNHYLTGSSNGILDRIGFSYEKAQNAWRTAINGQTVNFPDPNVVAEAVYCVCIIRSGSTVQLYMNETLLGSFPINSTHLPITSLLVGQEEDCSGGCFAQNQCTNGRINNLCFWNRSLNLDEIKFLCSSVDEKLIEDAFGESPTLFPNPATDLIQISNSQNIASIEIFDQNGKLVLNSSSSSEIDIRSLSPGLYLLKANEISGEQIIRRFIKE